MPKRRARNHSAADVLAMVDQNRPFPRFPLTDEQWSEVAKLSEIPEGEHDARQHIETTIGLFRQFQASDLDRVTPARIREELEALAVLAQDLNIRLGKLIKERDAYNAMTGTAILYSPLDRRGLMGSGATCNTSMWFKDYLSGFGLRHRGSKPTSEVLRQEASIGWSATWMEYGNATPERKLLALTRTMLQSNTSPTSVGLPILTSEMALLRRQ
jgi:hypothetical protein